MLVILSTAHQGQLDGLVENCSISSALAMEILQSWTKPSKYYELTMIAHTLLLWARYGISFVSILETQLHVKLHVYLHSIFEAIHDDPRTGESQNRKKSEGQLQTHDDVKQLVHLRDLVHALEDGDEDGRKNGNGTSQQNSLPTLPFQVQETLDQTQK